MMYFLTDYGLPLDYTAFSIHQMHEDNSLSRAQQITRAIWEKGMTIFQKSFTAEIVLSSPFNTYIIATDDAILCFTQKFTDLSGLNAVRLSPPFIKFN